MIAFEKDVAIVDLHVSVSRNDVDLPILKCRRRMLVHYYDRKLAASLENGPEMARTLGIEMLR